GSGDVAIRGRGGAGGVTSDHSVGTDAGRAGAAGSRFVDWRSGSSEALDRGVGGRLTTSVRARPVSRGLPLPSAGRRAGLDGVGVPPPDSECGSRGGSGVRSEVDDETSRARFTSALPAGIWTKSTMSTLTVPTIVETRTSRPIRALGLRLNSKMRW